MITAKISIQQLWRTKIGWYDIISETLLTKWKANSRLLHLSNLQIGRWSTLGPDIDHAELHGFADASIHAYAAVVYIKIVPSSGHVTTLLIGKSKVAPLKLLSIPRLELSVALLLARLLEFVRESSGYKNIPCYC